MEYIVDGRFLMQCIPAEGDSEIIVPDGTDAAVIEALSAGQVRVDSIGIFN